MGRCDLLFREPKKPKTSKARGGEKAGTASCEKAVRAATCYLPCGEGVKSDHQPRQRLIGLPATRRASTR